MTTMRRLLLVSSLVLLGGCATCPGPSHPTDKNCWYWMKVTNIDQTTGWVTGKYPEGLIKKDKSANPTKEFNFFVRDFDRLVAKNLLRVGGEYYFNNAHGSPYLVVFPEGYLPDTY
jgi:hypothetical protein